MKKLAIPISLAMVAALAACGTPGNTQSTRVIGGVDANYVAASGTVYAVGAPVRSGAGTVLALLDPTGPYSNVSRQYVTMRMNDGSTQSFEVEGVQLEFREAIRIRTDGTIQRPLPK